MNHPQITSTILMIRPVSFRMNEQTAVNNYYQKVMDGLLPETVQQLAQQEFDTFVTLLQSHGIEVVVVQDTPQPATPDSIFPNNWVSFHSDGCVALYPMYAENRRTERRNDILQELKNKGFGIEKTIDYTNAEQENRFLEGTGSMILDRENKLAYAAISPRTDKDLFAQFCTDFAFAPIAFHAYQSVGAERKLMYHTNVMMCIATHYAIVCLDCVDKPEEKEFLRKTIEDSGKELILISEEQVNRFAGNMLQVKNQNDAPFLVMSSSAYHSLSASQKETIEHYNPIIHSAIDTIEACGGGSARCMMAEVFLPKK